MEPPTLTNYILDVWRNRQTSAISSQWGNRQKWPGSSSYKIGYNPSQK